MKHALGLQESDNMNINITHCKIHGPFDVLKLLQENNDNGVGCHVLRDTNAVVINFYI